MNKFILAISLITFSSIASATNMTCTISADDTFISKTSVELDQSGAGTLDAGQYDDLSFGASAAEGKLESLWASWLTKSEESAHILIESAHGELVLFECVIE